MMLIKVLARELMGLRGSLISHLMSTFHDNTNANGAYCSLNLHDDTSKCKGSQRLLMSVRKSKRDLTAPRRLWNAFQTRKWLNLVYYVLCLLGHMILLLRVSPNSAAVPQWHLDNRLHFYWGEVTGCSGQAMVFLSGANEHGDEPHTFCNTGRPRRVVASGSSQLF